MPEGFSNYWEKTAAGHQLTLYDSSCDQGRSMSSDVRTFALKMPSRGSGRLRGKDHRLHHATLMSHITCNTHESPHMQHS